MCIHTRRRDTTPSLTSQQATNNSNRKIWKISPASFLAGPSIALAETSSCPNLDISKCVPGRMHSCSSCSWSVGPSVGIPLKPSLNQATSPQLSDLHEWYSLRYWCDGFHWPGCWPGFQDTADTPSPGCSGLVSLPQHNISNQANQGELLSLSKHSMWLARQNFLKGNKGAGKRGSRDGWAIEKTVREPCGHCTERKWDLELFFRRLD